MTGAWYTPEKCLRQGKKGRGEGKGEKQNQTVLVEFADLAANVETAELQAISGLQAKGAPNHMGEQCLSCPQTLGCVGSTGKAYILPSPR